MFLGRNVRVVGGEVEEAGRSINQGEQATLQSQGAPAFNTESDLGKLEIDEVGTIAAHLAGRQAGQLVALAFRPGEEAADGVGVSIDARQLADLIPCPLWDFGVWRFDRSVKNAVRRLIFLP